MEKPQKDEIQNWLLHPVGQWFLSELEVSQDGTQARLLAAEDNQLYRAQGEARLLKAIKDMLDA